MALVEPESGHVWLSVPLSECVEVVVTGEIHSWHTHWYRGPGSRSAMAVRCVREERGACDWCRAEYERRVRYVFPCRWEDEPRVVELGRVQYPSLAAVVSMYGWLGSRLRLSRDRASKNAPISLRRVGSEIIPQEAVVDLSEFVRSLGVGNLRMLDNLQVLGQIEAPGHSSNGRSRT